jgi:hypothetical protein
MIKELTADGSFTKSNDKEDFINGVNTTFPEKIV